MRIFLAFIAFLYSPFVYTLSANIDQAIKSLPKEIKQTIATWGAPSMAVGVVYKGKVVFIKAEGLKETGKPEKVDKHTMYRIASGTKTMTAVLLKKMGEKGILSLDDKVTKYIPDLKFFEASTTKNLTINDIISQQTGLKPFSLDPLWVLGFDKKDIIKAFSIIPQASPLGTYSYQNIAYALTNDIIEKVSQKSYHQTLNDLILKPLSMLCTTANPSQMPVSNSSFTNFKNKITSLLTGGNWFNNIATPHTIDLKGKTVKVNYFQPFYEFPSSFGCSMCLNDAVKWLKFMMDPTKLLSDKSAAEILTPKSTITIKETSAQYPVERFISGAYGQGLFIYQYGTKENSTRIYVELGAYGGNMFFMAWSPEYEVGIVTLANLGGIRTSFANQTLTYKFFDQVLGLPGKNWDATIKKRMKDIRDKNKNFLIKQKLLSSKATKKLENYTGTYTNKLYGEITFVEKSGNLTMKYRGRNIPLTHWNGNLFKYKPEKLSKSYAVTDTAYVDWYLTRDGNYCYINQLSQPTAPDNNQFFKKIS